MEVCSRQRAPMRSPFGFFEVRDGRVLHLDNQLQTKDYDSIEGFAAALANPPATTVAVTR